jgi:hypothetical protein
MDLPDKTQRRKEFLDDCLKKSLTFFNYQICAPRIIDQMQNADFDSMCLYLTFEWIADGLRNGKDHFINEVIEKKPVVFTTKEITEFAKLYKGPEFSKHVHFICQQKLHDTKMIKLTIEKLSE